MESLSTYLSEQTVRQIGWVLVHFLWQGFAGGAILWAVLKILGRTSSQTRYLTGCAGMVLMMTAPVVTFTLLSEPEAAAPAPQVSIAEPVVAAQAFQHVTVVMQDTIPPEVSKKPLGAMVSETLEAALPWCVIGWAAGVAALSLWYLGGWCQLQKLRLIGTKPAPERIAAQTADLARRLGISRAVRVSESVLVQVPTMLGWLKPVILLPATAVTGLDEMQLRAMIAHELAHIKRHDYLVNILQTAVEILGFYHPAVWWMSKQIRIERENCCDDMAADLLQDRTAYAKALFSMEALRAQQLALALHASGGSLVDRIARLIGTNETPRIKSGWIASAATLLIVCGLLVSAAMAMSNKTDEADAEISNDKLIVYPVDQKVSAFPEKEDFSTPEGAYAAINRVMASGSREGWIRVSTKDNAQRIAQSQRQDQPVPPEWAKVVLNARILEVLIQGDRAMVIAEFPQELSSQKIVNPIDARSLKLEDGKWLNAGEDRFNTVEEAAEKFGALVEREDKTEAAYRNALDESAKFEKMAEELFDKLRSADYEEILSFYDTYSGHWRQDGWKKLDLDYRVYTDWPSFAAWVCRTFKDNPIVSVELSDTILSQKEFDGQKAPAVPYKLTLKDGSVLQGELYFAYRASSDTWQPAEGIDWHLQKEPIKHADFTKEQQALKLGSTDPLQKLGLAHAIVGQNYGEDVTPGSIEDLRPFLENDTYRLSCEWKDIPFLMELAPSTKLVSPAPARLISSYHQKNAYEGMIALWLIESIRREQSGGRGPLNPLCIPAGKGELQDEWQTSRVIHQQVLAAYQTWWQNVAAMPPAQAAQIDPMQGSAWRWFGYGVQTKETVVPIAAESPPALTASSPVEVKTPKLLLGPNGTGYFDRDAVIQMGAIVVKVGRRIEAKNTGTDIVEITSDKTEGKLSLGLGGTGHFDRDAAIQIGDASIRVRQRIEVTNTGSRIIEIVTLKGQSQIAAGGLGGGMMGGFGGAPKSDAPDQIIFPKNWDEIVRAGGEDPNRLSAEFGSVDGMQIVVYEITEFLAGSFDQDYMPGQAGVNRAAERLIKDIESIEPESWRSNGGQGQVDVHGSTKLMIRQSPEVHQKIADYLARRRIQVAIEARFLLLGELFEGSNKDAERHGQVIEGFANSDEIKAAMETKPLAERNLPAIEHKPPQKVDSETEQSIIRAAQQFKNSRVLTAPKAMVLNFKSASMWVGRPHSYADAANETKEIDQGVVLDLLPVVQDDGKTILLKTYIQVTDVLDERTQVIDGKEYTIPWVQVTTIPFQATVESGGTILVEGPEVSARNDRTGEIEKQRLLIMLKPTVLAPPEDM